MDVPTRQSYTMAAVVPTNVLQLPHGTISWSIGAAVSPSLTGVLLASPALIGAPFLISGSLKIGYDLLLYRNFKKADVK